MARNFLERFAASGVNAIPPQLLDGLAVYENDLRNQVESIYPYYLSCNFRTRQPSGQSQISN